MRTSVWPCEFRWAAADGSGGWTRSPDVDTASALMIIRSAPPVHVPSGTRFDLALDPPPGGFQVFAWQSARPTPLMLASDTSQSVLDGRVVYEIRARWDYSAAGQGNAAYVIQFEAN